MGPVVHRNARPGDPRTTLRRHPTRGMGAAHRAAAHHELRGGPRPPVGHGGEGMATGGPWSHKRGEWGGALAHRSARHPPHLPPHRQRAPGHRDTHWGRDAPPIRWLSPEGGAAPLTTAHFKTGRPAYDDALSKLGDVLGPLLLMLPTSLATALRQELDSCEGLRVGWEAVADGSLLALLHPDAADECQWGTLVPHLSGHHVYMATPPPGTSPPGVG